MNILHVTPRYPPQAGGVETHVEEISERLVDRGHSVTVFTADAGKEGRHREERNGVHVRRFRSLAPGGAFHISPQITLAVRQREFDVVHAHNYHSLPLLFTALGGQDARFIVTPHYHGGSASGHRDALLSLYAPVGRWALQRADAVIAVSEWEVEQLARDFGIDALKIPNGLDVERFQQAEPEVHDRPYLLCVGRLEAYKGVQEVIRALPKLPKFDLLIAGDGPYRQTLAELAADEGVGSQVEFLGYVDNVRLPGLYAGAEVFVTLSEFEAYGMTVAEALAAGTPCVVREAGALRNWVSVPGVEGMVNPQPDCVAACVEAAQSEGVEFDAPSWDTVVDQLLDVYARNRPRS